MDESLQFQSNAMEAGHRSAPRLAIEDDFYVGPWLVQPRLNLITGRDTTTQVEPKIMQVLARLAAQPGAAVTRTQLHETVWPDTIVSDKVLTRAISELRKTFDDDPRNPRVIATISKTGYRLIAPVSFEYSGDLGMMTVRPSVLQQRRRLPVTYLLGGVALLALVASALAGVFSSKNLDAPPRPVPFTTFAGHELGPELSPDGDEVAFAWQGPSGDNWDIYVKKLGSEAPLRLTNNPADDLRPVFSPDGSRIAFMRFAGSDCSILIVPALSGAERKLAPCDGIETPNRAFIAPRMAWSPDGKTLAISSSVSGQASFGIVLLSLETLEKKPLTTPPAAYLGDTNPTFSPDGNHLAFVRYRTLQVADLYLVSVADGKETQRTFDNRPILGHDWTPDGRRLVFASDREGPFNLWTTPASGDDEPTWVPIADWHLESPALGRRHRRMVYESWLYDVNIWRIPLASAQPQQDVPSTRLLASTFWDIHPRYAPDGNRIAFVSNRAGSYEVWISNHDGSSPSQLTRFEGPLVGFPSWSSDGRHLVFQTRLHGNADLYRIDVEEGVPRRLTSDPADKVAASWSPDGDWIYFGSDRSGTWQIWRMPADGGETVQITQNGGYAALASDDGQFLYYAKRDKAGIWRTPVEGGQETMILDALAPGDWGNWTLFEDGLYFFQRQGRSRRATLSFYRFATDSVHSLTNLRQAPPLHRPGLSLSPDRQWMLYTQLDQTQSDLMLVEDFR